MTSATTSASTRTGGRRGEGRGYGMVFFAAILLLVVGFFNMISQPWSNRPMSSSP